MRILLLGDISLAANQSYSVDSLDFLLDVDHIIANLEGPILPEREIKEIEKNKDRVLYNSPAVVDVLEKFKVDQVSLANNHIFDHGDNIHFTKRTLTKAGIGCFGAGDSLTEAQKPYVLPGKERDLKVFGFGWDVIGCQYPVGEKPGVNPLEPDHLLQTIRDLRANDSRSAVIFYLHWNYELEKYPQPADRQLARKLIEEGVDAVIGLHPHIPQGAESYRGKPIIYSLGNWFFPPRNFGPVSLNFSPAPSRQIAVEINLSPGQTYPVHFHWVIFDPLSQTIQFERTEGWDGEMIAELSPFSGMSDREYLSWFRLNKKKHISLPIYRD
ncbi:MAG: hypothetical protein DRI65_18730, partial [Chloroflexota bacterium]